MVQVYEGFAWADVVVFASPQYWGTISGQLKVVIDRLYAPLFRYGSEMRKEFVVIMTSRGNMYGMTENPVLYSLENRRNNDSRRNIFGYIQQPVCEFVLSPFFLFIGAKVSFIFETSKSFAEKLITMNHEPLTIISLRLCVSVSQRAPKPRGERNLLQLGAL